MEIQINDESLNINGVEYKENDIMLFKTSPKYKQYNTSNIDSFTLKINLIDNTHVHYSFDSNNNKEEIQSSTHNKFIEEINEIVDKDEYIAAPGCDIFSLPPVKVE